MKKNLKQILATTFAGFLAFATLGTAVPNVVSAAEESTESYKVFVAFGGDLEGEDSWGLQYYGGDITGDITPTDGELAVGETVTVGLEFAEPVETTYFVAPVLVGENIVDADFDVKVLVDGEEVDADLTAGDNWWYEGTGDYDDTQAVRIAGGYNEWGDQYIEKPSGFTKIEFEITANSIQIGDGTEVAGEESTETYNMFVAFGGDLEGEDSWGLQYYGGDITGDITPTDGEISVGETVTVGLEFAEPVATTYFVAPVLVGENIVDADFDVKVLVDGEEVDADLTAGDNWWYEGTGDYGDTQAVRIAGGYNEWGTQYIEMPSGFTKIEFEITANSIKVGVADEATSNAGDVDLDGVYHAYIGFQTPNWSFRNAWHGEGGYGHDTDEFSQVTGWDADGNEVVIPGTLNDVEIAGNGTYTVSVTGLEFPDGEFDSQEYMNLIFVSTDIPNTGAIEFSDVTLKVDGSEVSGVNAIVDPDSINYVDVQLQSIWNDDISTIGYYPTPMTELSITFTVSGFNYDNEGTAVVTSDDNDSSDEAVAKKGVKPFVIVIIVVVVVVVAAVVILLVTKKKKN
jgi:hypothetical protein